jgi:hypothetical protein
MPSILKKHQPVCDRIKKTDKAASRSARFLLKHADAGSFVEKIAEQGGDNRTAEAFAHSPALEETRLFRPESLSLFWTD